LTILPPSNGRGKPCPDFPLQAHKSGHWAKEIRGKPR